MRCEAFQYRNRPVFFANPGKGMAFLPFMGTGGLLVSPVAAAPSPTSEPSPTSLMQLAEPCEAKRV